MMQFGIDLVNLKLRGMLAFVAVKGRPEKAVSVIQDQYSADVKLDVTGKFNK